MSDDIEIRKEVLDFAVEMELTLRDNDHKTGWDEMSIHALYKRIKDEFEEFQEQYILFTHSYLVEDSDFERQKIQELRKEAIDMANFCMFLCHNYPDEQREKEMSVK